MTGSALLSVFLDTFRFIPCISISFVFIIELFQYMWLDHILFFHELVGIWVVFFFGYYE